MAQDSLIDDYEILVNRLEKYVETLQTDYQRAMAEISRCHQLLEQHNIAYDDEDVMPFEDFEDLATSKLGLDINWQTAAQTQLGLKHGVIHEWKKRGLVPRMEYDRASTTLTAAKKRRRRVFTRLQKERLRSFLMTGHMTMDTIASAFNREFPDDHLTKNDANNFKNRDPETAKYFKKKSLAEKKSLASS